MTGMRTLVPLLCNTSYDFEVPTVSNRLCKVDKQVIVAVLYYDTENNPVFFCISIFYQQKELGTVSISFVSTFFQYPFT